MQVTPKYRKKIDRWVVDTRPKGIKKLAGGKGEQKKFRVREDAENHAALINAAQRVGGSVTTSTSATIAAAAALLAAKTELRVQDGKITYGSGQNIISNVKTWVDLDLTGVPFSEIKCSAVTTADIEDRLISQIDRSAKTIKEKLDALKQLFDLAHRQGWCGHVNPARQVRLEEVRYARGAVKKKLTRFKVEEIRDVIRAAMDADDWCDGLALSFAAQTGLRFGELAALVWSDIDFERRSVTVNKTVREVSKGVYEVQSVVKTDAGFRTVFLTPQLLAELKKWKLASPFADLVFPTRAGSFHRTSDNLRKRVLHSACCEVGIDDLRWHDLRHFFASICLELFGGDFNRITTLMGHKSIGTTRDLYGHWIDDAERDENDAEQFGNRLWA